MTSGKDSSVSAILIFLRWLGLAVYRMGGSGDNESLAAYECYFVMNMKRNSCEMLQLHKSGDAPYQKHFVLEDVRKICVELAPSTYLDVGCNRGQLITAVKKNLHNRAVCVGVEMNAIAAKSAEQVCDRVYSSTFDAAINGLKADYPGGFDVISFADVLEHMYDPWEAMVLAKELLSERGKCVFQIPNTGHRSIIGGLLSNRFDYELMGLLDVTHIRFFTPGSFEDACQQAGYKIMRKVQIMEENPQPVLSAFGTLIAGSEDVKNFLRILGVTQIDLSLLTMWQICYVCEPL
ncbi:MAG: class I SAM-dependent methyltransferase [Pseudomonadota bacterium]|nr:class I SAM-dependent methyltransferase [Chloroflexota bacterium]MDQ3267740.1 class I SAM-dependent methyltransferase [Pseudomonadota bacterium]